MGSTVLLAGMASAILGIIVNMFTGESGEWKGVVLYKIAYALILAGAITLAVENG